MDDSTQNKKHPEPESTRRNHVPPKEYGLLKVLEFPDGTVVHINTKKGEENLRIYHSSGTYDEITSEGTKISFSSNNAVSYAKRGMTMTYDHSSDTKSGGHWRLCLDHDAHIEVKKNASLVVGGHADVASLGHLKIAAKGNMYLGSEKGKVVVNGGKGVEIKGEQGRVMIEAASALYLHSKQGDVHLESSSEDVVIRAAKNVDSRGQNVIEQASGDITETAQGKITTTGQDSVFVKSGGDITTKGKTTKIQGGGTTAPPTTFV
jgi:uncharacterized protein (DUF2345 family)